MSDVVQVSRIRVCLLQDGVVLGADTRSTAGSTVADKNCEKIHFIAPNIYCCGAGTAADTENVTGQPPAFLTAANKGNCCFRSGLLSDTLLRRHDLIKSGAASVRHRARIPSRYCTDSPQIAPLQVMAFLMPTSLYPASLPLLPMSCSARDWLHPIDYASPEVEPLLLQIPGPCECCPRSGRRRLQWPPSLHGAHVPVKQ